MVKRKKTLYQKLKKDESKKIPDIPNHYFQRPEVPPPTVLNGKTENKRHYRYKIYLGETIRNHLPQLKINYEWQQLPEFYHNRYGRYVHYTPDIFVWWTDNITEKLHIADIEINGLKHYTEHQIIKNLERKNLIYPYLIMNKDLPYALEPFTEDYRRVVSYIIFDVDDFEYRSIAEIYKDFQNIFMNGGLYPKDMDLIFSNLLAVGSKS